MSQFSGKCDVYDSLIAIHEYTDDELKNIKFYIGESLTPLVINSRKDLIPYYPHLIGMSAHDNVARIATIHITEKSFVDIEEQERLNMYFKDIMREYNKCKRKKIDFDVEETVAKIAWITNKDIVREIAYRVQKNGKKATYDDLHIPIHEYYRKQLVEEMLLNGLDPKAWGYERFLE